MAQQTISDLPQDQTLALRSFAFDHLSAIAAVLDASGRIVDTNAAWRLFARLNEASAGTTGPGLNYLEVCDRAAATGDKDASLVAAGLRQLLTGERDHFDHEYLCPSPAQDRWFMVQASAAPVTDGAGVVLFHVDITARKLREDHLVIEAEHDRLTGLPNRRHAVRFLQAKLDDAQVTGEAVWVLYFDLDRFKGVNDAYGHRLGDELLVQVAARAQRMVREADLLCRLAGDEFILVCPGIDGGNAASIADRLRVVLSRPFQFGPTEVTIGASVGSACADAGSTVDALLHAADAQMYLDKGRNRHGGQLASAAPHRSPSRSRRTRRRATNPGSGSGHVAVTGLEPSRAMIEAIVARSNDLVMFFRSDGTIEWASPACRTLFGVDPEVVVGRNGFDMIHPDDQQRVLTEFAAMTGRGDHVRTEFRVVDRTGRVRWIEEVATNLVDEPGVGVVVGNLRDVTERKQAEEAVRFQARLLAAVGQAVVAVDTAGTVIYWNDGAQATYGWTADEALGQPIQGLIRPADGWAARAEQIRSQLDEGASWSGAFQVIAKGGSEIPIMVSDTPVHDEHGEHVATIGVSVDMTAQLQRDELATRLSAIVESSTDAIFSTDLDGVVTTWNAAAETLYGHTATDMIGRSSSELVPPAHAAALWALIDRIRHGETVQSMRAVGRHANDRDLHIAISLSPMRDASTSIVGASAIVRDISERIELNRRIDAERRRLADAQATARLGSFEIDLDTGHVTRSAEMWRILGCEPGSSSDDLLDHVAPEDRDQLRQDLEEALAGSRDVERTHRILRPDGEVRWVVTRSTRSLDPSSRVLTGTTFDITERREAELALAHQATHDQLTGLPNRAGLFDMLGAHLSGRTTPRRLSAVAFVDLDRFKVINDTLSHAVGDQTLRAVAERLRTALPATDIVARHGGDEFVVVRPDSSTLADAEELAQDAQRLFATPFTVGDHRIELTASIGVTLSSSSDSHSSLLHDAGTAMYQAKEGGGNQTIVFDGPSRARAHRRTALERALPQAVDSDELHLEYQPVLDLATNEVAGFEALLRWDHPTMGRISPAEFIPLAEANGLITRIGQRVLRQALHQLADWHRDPRVRPDLWMAINLSAIQLVQPTLVAQVAATIAGTGLPPALVHLEITESVLMDRLDDATPTIAALRALGVRISIDDFGTGYSSLSYLDRLPLDILKIDRSFVHNLGTGRSGAPIVSALTHLATTLGLDVIAEGIEDPGQLELVRQLGCHYGQGFLWSASLAPDHALSWMTARTCRSAPTNGSQSPLQGRLRGPLR